MPLSGTEQGVLLAVLAESFAGFGVVARIEIFAEPEDRSEMRYDEYAGLAGTIFAASVVAAVALMFKEGG